MDKLQQIRAEIERRFNDNIDAAMRFSEESEPRQLFASAAKEDYDLLSFVESLPEEQFDWNIARRIDGISPKSPLISINEQPVNKPKATLALFQGDNATFRDWQRRNTNAAMTELEEKIKMFSEAHRGETTDEILAQMRGEEPKDSNPCNNGKDLQESVSKELEKEIDTEVLKLRTAPFYDELANFAIHFVNWQREQMMKDAVEAECLMLPPPDLFKVLLCHNITDRLAKNEKVKMIIIKED